MKMSPRYAAKYGFDKMPDYKHDFASIPMEHLVIPECDSNYTLKDLKDVDEAKVIDYDIGIAHRSRAKYLMNFISTKDCFTKVPVAFNTSGEVVGIGCVRAVFSNELCAGPFYSDNEVMMAYYCFCRFQDCFHGFSKLSRNYLKLGQLNRISKSLAKF
ncbi:unnamed protein product [Heligmosomoides polygyrus]|uniref:YitH acetyltransferase (GNAT) domain-containing protein n=1 Tax=Heligmosomoides polygyrus TaxID=6339 RepID=A0A3P7YI86_HELPZ|nr:unnamed protein product [Heligmosomoides polygyrus]